MQKSLIYFVSLVLVFSCKQEKTPEILTNSKTEFVSFQNTPKTQKFNPRSEGILSAWPEFQEMQDSFEVLYRSDNNEDLVLAINDLLEKEKNLRESTYPKEFDKAQVKSRQKVLRTFLLKVKASLAENTDVNTPLKEMLIARNAFRNQFNVVINNKLDTELILDES
ncbi:hypothetical protein [uncultured Croceitalea sp.]|uniref:hypothetical protein n=1 Tax=uncultured Croceitalea sp. TaxID=1798908 RepID=UPI00374FD382